MRNVWCNRGSVATCRAGLDDLLQWRNFATSCLARRWSMLRWVCGCSQPDRTAQLAALANTQPVCVIETHRDGVVVTSQNLAQIELRFFSIDAELLFSKQPFAQATRALHLWNRRWRAGRKPDHAASGSCLAS